MLTFASREWMSAPTSEAVIPRLTTWSLRIVIPPASAVPIHEWLSEIVALRASPPDISFSRDLFYDFGGTGPITDGPQALSNPRCRCRGLFRPDGTRRGRHVRTAWCRTQGTV
ncbi:hypothetical protein MES4922_190001 [Mesorhizobium ventifaucium]|uniref:Uncharacterized protein n=1 Tax=Mesorhizobium ventifaucium TaxID=666020 RepID=A0ABM9DKI6_9HYPH|nr:hypothetical protein MES4922_190001 [Mesorhizobium ventifaucium]